MPLVNPIISKVVPVKVGGSASAGVGRLASAVDHVHPLVETSGPTELGTGPIPDLDFLRRSGPLIEGRTLATARLMATQNSSVVTLADVHATQMGFNLKDDSGNMFMFVVAYRTAAATTGLRLAVNYTGTFSLLRYGLLGATSATAFQSGNIAANDTPLGAAGVGPGAADVTAVILGFCRTITGGNLALRYASGVAGSAVTIQIGSCCFMIQQ
jgi:hypothetical protein